jgi:membrane complex biogenesis BtpA family protein
MIHLLPLPGSAGAAAQGRRYRGFQELIDRAVREALLLADSGFDAVVVENFGDAPFAADRVSAETVASMAIVTDHVVRTLAKSRKGVPVGVNVLRNDALSGLAVAGTAGAAFIRVNVLSGVYATDQGLISGRAEEVVRQRARLCPEVRIAADVHVKHAAPISQPDIVLAAEETAHRAGADALIVSGAGTGKQTDLAAVGRVRAGVPDRPVWIGSGVTSETVRDCLEAADGVIVGTALKQGGRTTAPIDPARVRAFLRAAGR